MFLLFFTDYKLKGFQQRNILQQKNTYINQLKHSIKIYHKIVVIYIHHLLSDL